MSVQTFTGKGDVRKAVWTTKERTCAECGEALDHPGQFHPEVFCTLKKRYPSKASWDVFRDTAALYGIDLPVKAPLISDTPRNSR